MPFPSITLGAGGGGGKGSVQAGREDTQLVPQSRSTCRIEKGEAGLSPERCDPY